ncbi:MAG: UDP-3-O-[3-hydroxymyristoyl] N-acetylglucosamine deacetylase [Robiginitomaculum sp.]|nr:MAG: UDP-3-O-[3-hydroxymyristoyl] N-acetylglucosamine deacetylase [Robiginitomaculum sp.]
MTIDVSVIPVQRQATLSRSIECEGVSLHGGQNVRLVLKPAPVNTGIVFVRVDVSCIENHIAVRADAVTDVKRCTTISNMAGIQVSTIEHLMAAFSAVGIDNLTIEIDGPELPALDGSAEPFLRLIEQAGIVSQPEPRRYIKVLKPVEVQIGDAYARIDPYSCLYLDVTINFTEAAIGLQRIEIEPDVKTFRERMASARTFARAHEVVALREAGLSLGGSYDNAIVVDGSKVLNPGGLRFADEFVRHKALDLLGDMYIGGPLLGRVTTIRGGHALNHQLLLALFADSKAWKFTHLATAQKMPKTKLESVSGLEGVSGLEETVSPL